MKKEKYIVLLCLLCFLSSLCAGCGYFEKKSKIEEVLSADPSFKQVLDKKKNLDDSVADLESKMKERKRQIDDDINDMKKRYAQYKKDIEQDIKRMQADFTPYITAIQFKKEDIQSQIKSMTSKIKSLNNMLKELKSLSVKPSEEGEDWAARILEVENQVSQLRYQVESLQDELKLVNLKLSLLE